MHVCDVATYISGPDAEFLTNQQNMRMQAVGNIMGCPSIMVSTCTPPQLACMAMSWPRSAVA